MLMSRTQLQHIGSYYATKPNSDVHRFDEESRRGAYDRAVSGPNREGCSDTTGKRVTKKTVVL
jgi:hypothetical protein